MLLVGLSRHLISRPWRVRVLRTKIRTASPGRRWSRREERETIGRHGSAEFGSSSTRREQQCGSRPFSTAS